MAVKKSGDTFANIAYLSVIESAANTLTFAALQLATTLMTEKAALIIHRAEFNLTNLAVLNSTTDYTDICLTVSDRLTAAHDLSAPELLFFRRTQRIDFGTAASGVFRDDPVAVDFTSLPGGGIIVPADRLYVGICSVGAANPNGVQMRLFYTVKSLEIADYWDLVEARRVMTT